MYRNGARTCKDSACSCLWKRSTRIRTCGWFINLFRCISNQFYLGAALNASALVARAIFPVSRSFSFAAGRNGMERERDRHKRMLFLSALYGPVSFGRDNAITQRALLRNNAQAIGETRSTAIVGVVSCANWSCAVLFVRGPWQTLVRDRFLHGREL